MGDRQNLKPLELKPLTASPLYRRRKLSLQNEKDNSDVEPDYAELGAPSNKNVDEWVNYEILYLLFLYK